MASNQLSNFQTEMNKIKTSNMQDKDKIHSMISLLEEYEEMFERVNYLSLLEEVFFESDILLYPPISTCRDLSASSLAGGSLSKLPPLTLLLSYFKRNNTNFL